MRLNTQSLCLAFSFLGGIKMHFHQELKNGKAGNGAQHADYILRQGEYAKKEIAKEFVEAKVINLPEWAETPQEFFSAGDQLERKNGNVYAEFVLGLQNEFTLEENKELIEKFIDEVIGRDKVIVCAVHQKIGATEKGVFNCLNEAADAQNVLEKTLQKQLHVHIMFNERIITDTQNIKPPEQFFKRFNSKNPEKGGYKKEIKFNDGSKRMHFHLLQYRQTWADIINTKFAEKGLTQRVTAKSINTQIKEAEQKGDNELAAELKEKKRNYIPTKLYKKAILILNQNISFEDKIQQLGEIYINPSTTKHYNSIEKMIKLKIRKFKKNYYNNKKIDEFIQPVISLFDELIKLNSFKIQRIQSKMEEYCDQNGVPNQKTFERLVRLAHKIIAQEHQQKYGEPLLLTTKEEATRRTNLFSIRYERIKQLHQYYANELGENYLKQNQAMFSMISIFEKIASDLDTPQNQNVELTIEEKSKISEAYHRMVDIINDQTIQNKVIALQTDTNEIYKILRSKIKININQTSKTTPSRQATTTEENPKNNIRRRK